MADCERVRCRQRQHASKRARKQLQQAATTTCLVALLGQLAVGLPQPQVLEVEGHAVVRLLLEQHVERGALAVVLELLRRKLVGHPLRHKVSDRHGDEGHDEGVQQRGHGLQRRGRAHDALAGEHDVHALLPPLRPLRCGWQCEHARGRLSAARVRRMHAAGMRGAPSKVVVPAPLYWTSVGAAVHVPGDAFSTNICTVALKFTGALARKLATRSLTRSATPVVRYVGQFVSLFVLLPAACSADCSPLPPLSTFWSSSDTPAASSKSDSATCMEEPSNT